MSLLPHIVCLGLKLKGPFVLFQILFGRNWKPFKPNSIIYYDTIPSMTNLVCTRDYIEAMALNAIVKEVMCSQGSTITFK